MLQSGTTVSNMTLLERHSPRHGLMSCFPTADATPGSFPAPSCRVTERWRKPAKPDSQGGQKTNRQPDKVQVKSCMLAHPPL